MWPFSRRPKRSELQSGIPAEEVVPPLVVRRVEITVEREWTSTVVRKKAGETSEGTADSAKRE
jgi:hypothetical protein